MFKLNKEIMQITLIYTNFKQKLCMNDISEIEY